MNGNLRPISSAQLAAAQALDPRNVDDAEYIAAHPRDFAPDLVRAAEGTLRRAYDPARFAALYHEDGTPRDDAPDTSRDFHDHTCEAREALRRRRRQRQGRA